MSTQQVSSENIVRNAANFHPNIWGNHFLTCPSQTIDSWTQQHHKELKEEVRKMMVSDANKPAQRLRLIDTVQRLGVAYHFEKEIDDALEKIGHDPFDDKDDLYIVSLCFRLLRQHGIKISCDVFEKFKDDDGKFKASLMNDVQGMLSLYEAAHLAIHGEDILDEAIVFTTTHLKSTVSNSPVNSTFAEQIRHSLRVPLRKAVPRLESRYFLDIYSRDDLHDKTLLNFAKLDFNILQAMHQKEASEMTRWWRDFDFLKKLPYIRDRVVELYFWILVGVSYQPKFSTGRIFLSKIICLETLVDDTFDAYGTFDELAIFTEAVTRWDLGHRDALPEYMKFIFKTLIDVYSEAEQELAKEGRSYSIHYAIRSFQELVMKYFCEAKWLNKGYVPSLDDYKSVSLRSIGFLPIAVASFVFMGDIATKEVFEWEMNNPKIIIAAETIFRFLDDIAGHRFEQKREHSPSAIECYKNQHGVSEEEAVKALSLEVANSWKDINEELLLNPMAIPLPLLQVILDLSRSADFMYGNAQDRFTHSTMMKDQVDLVLKDPVKLDD
uniref:Alpha-santalene synthase n=2 Tax=Eukaryota TaxID=2759 RepID=A0A4P8PGL5_YARLL|nr:Tps2-1 [Clausena lansium]QCQ77669.1 alpha-santalene synthase [Yarrowia lipolytica]